MVITCPNALERYCVHARKRYEIFDAAGAFLGDVFACDATAAVKVSRDTRVVAARLLSDRAPTFGLGRR